MSKRQDAFRAASREDKLRSYIISFWFTALRQPNTRE